MSDISKCRAIWLRATFTAPKNEAIAHLKCRFSLFLTAFRDCYYCSSIANRAV